MVPERKKENPMVGTPAGDQIVRTSKQAEQTVT